jgi:hypothetical protein
MCTARRFVADSIDIEAQPILGADLAKHPG